MSQRGVLLPPSGRTTARCTICKRSSDVSDDFSDGDGAHGGVLELLLPLSPAGGVVERLHNLAG
jgi:hypothetical protein